jgi:hypothetical protein
VPADYTDYRNIGQLSYQRMWARWACQESLK